MTGGHLFLDRDWGLMTLADLGSFVQNLDFVRVFFGKLSKIIYWRPTGLVGPSPPTEECWTHPCMVPFSNSPSHPGTVTGVTVLFTRTKEMLCGWLVMRQKSHFDYHAESDFTPWIFYVLKAWTEINQAIAHMGWTIYMIHISLNVLELVQSIFQQNDLKRLLWRIDRKI